MHRQQNPDALYTVKHNMWSDLSESERLAQFELDVSDAGEYDEVVEPEADSELMNLYATNLDWCNKGMCNAIRW